jgi:2-methylisocitrate lyase-like PEP mutase family enzyme
MPDMGLISLTELADATHVIAEATGLPLVVDADTGFGGAPAVRRAVHELVSAGAAAIQIEDQVSRKRCGYMEPEKCVAIEEMLARLKAARSSADVVLVARTDALGSEGLESAIERGRAYMEAGADVLMVNGITRTDELERIAGTTGPLLYNYSGSDAAPWISLDRARELGVAILIYPIHVARAMVAAARGVLAELAEGRPPSPGAMVSFREYMDLAGWADAEQLERTVAEDLRA